MNRHNIISWTCSTFTHCWLHYCNNYQEAQLPQR